jgi:hypothetical protein
LERQIGFWRIGPIYILSGFAGNLASCIFLPNTITVGASGAAFGLAGVLVADLILNWGIVQRPYLNALFLLARTTHDTHRTRHTPHDTHGVCRVVCRLVWRWRLPWACFPGWTTLRTSEG